MTAEEFVARRQPQWAELERLVGRSRGGRLRRAPAGALERLAVLSRHAQSDLAIARRDHPGDTVVEYLNNLCARTHSVVYRGDPLRPGRLGAFFATGLPRTVRALWPYALASLGLMLAGVAAGWMAVEVRPDLAPSIVPHSPFDEMAQGTLQPGLDHPGLIASVIITNNVRVALVCFAGGILLGVPTALMLVVNGWMLGTLGAHVQDGGYALSFWPYLMPHGFIELTIVVLAGAAGLYVGDSILRPGLLGRGDAVAAAARRAVTVAAGTAGLLVAAGLLEGFVSPSALAGWAKALIGLATAVALYSWILLAGRGRPAARVHWGAWRSSESPRAATATAWSRPFAWPSRSERSTPASR